LRPWYHGGMAETRPCPPILNRIAKWTAAGMLLLAWYFASPPFAFRVAQRHFPAALPALTTIYRPSEYYVTHEELPGSKLYHWYMGRSDRIARNALREAIDPHAKLLEPTGLEFTGTPLRDVLSYASEIHEISLDLDASVDGEVKVTINASGIPMQKALEELLKPHGLIAVPDGERIIISTPEAIERKQTTAAAEVAAHARIVQTVLIVLLAVTICGGSARVNRNAGIRREQTAPHHALHRS
jgi:hypothetical protein